MTTAPGPPERSLTPSAAISTPPPVPIAGTGWCGWGDVSVARPAGSRAVNCSPMGMCRARECQVSCAEGGQELHKE